MTSVLPYVADWLLTWLMHATVACLITLLLAERLVKAPGLRDVLWKAALVLPLITAFVSIITHPFTSNSWQLATFARSHLPVALRSARVAVQTTSGLASGAQVQVQDPLVQWLRWLVLAGVLMPGMLALSRLVRARRRFRRELRLRRPTDARALQLDAGTLWLGQSTARISVAQQVGSAAAISSGEICVSEDFLKLSQAEQQGVLAHELAHLQRRDPRWIACADSIASLLAIQPLVGAVARRLRRDAEFVCDEMAVRQTGDAIAYVRALTVFAEKHAAVPAAALAYGSSRIVQRAERVLALRSHDSSHGPRLGAVLLAALVLLLLLSLPRVRTGQANAAVRAQVRTQVSAVAHAPGQIHVTVELR